MPRYDSLDEMVKSGARKKKLANRRGNHRKMKNGGHLSAAKAREILHDGTANGRPITKKQRGYFGAVASGKNRK